jgi:hypothetical protein
VVVLYCVCVWPALLDWFLIPPLIAGIPETNILPTATGGGGGGGGEGLQKKITAVVKEGCTEDIFSFVMWKQDAITKKTTCTGYKTSYCSESTLLKG